MSIIWEIDITNVIDFLNEKKKYILFCQIFLRVYAGDFKEAKRYITMINIKFI